jgi:tetratricopeptide (TPR) repeat protein
MGLEPKLSLEGLVFRVNQTPPPSGIDVPRTVQNIYSVFKYQGLLDKNRAFDNSVYKDENAYRLAQNYTAAHVQVAYQMQMAGQVDEAIRFIQDALKMSPDFPGLLEYLGRLYEDAGRPEDAYQIYQDGVRRYPSSAEFYYHLGVMKFSQGHIDEGIASLRKACELNQQYFDWFNALFTALWQTGQKEEGLEVLRGWVRAHPEDREGATNLARMEDSLRATGGAAGGAARR